MANNNSTPITWKQVGIIIMMLTLVLAGIGFINTKANKADVDKGIEKVEVRAERQIRQVQRGLKENIGRIELKQDKMQDKMDN